MPSVTTLTAANVADRKSIPPVENRRATWLGASSFILVALVLAALVGIVAGLSFHSDQNVLAHENPYLWMMEAAVWNSPPADKRAMLLAHKAFLASLAAFVLLFQFMPQRWRLRLRLFESAQLAWIAAVGLVGFLIGSFFTSPVAAQDQLFGLLFVVGLASALPLLKKLPNWIPITLLASSIILATLIALPLHPDFSACRMSEVVQSQQHYTVTMLLSDRLASGHGIHPQMSGLYNALPSLIFGLLEKPFGIPSFGGSVHILEVLQFLLLTTIACIYVRHGRKRSLLFALLAVVPLLAWYNCRAPGFEFPNHSAWRLLGCVVPLLILQSMRKTHYLLVSATCGAMAGLALLSNFETGIAAFAALAAFVFFMRGRSAAPGWKQWPAMVLPFVAACAAVILLFPLVFKGAFGCPPYFFNINNFLDTLKSSSLTSSPNAPSPLGFAIFGYAAFMLLKIAQMDPREINLRQAFRAFLASFILIWQAYYFVRPFPTNLASMLIFFGPFLIDMMRAARAYVAQPRRVNRNSILVTACFFAICLVPSVIADFRVAIPRYQWVTSRLALGHLEDNRVSVGPAVLFSDIYFPAPLGEFLDKKCACLTDLNSACPLNFLTIYSFVVPKKTGLFPKMPFMDPFFGVVTPKDYERMITELSKDGPKLIAIDDPDSDPALKGESWFVAFTESVKERLLVDYDLTHKTAGWLVFEKRPPGVKAVRTSAPIPAAKK